MSASLWVMWRVLLRLAPVGVLARALGLAGPFRWALGLAIAALLGLGGAAGGAAPNDPFFQSFQELAAGSWLALVLAGPLWGVHHGLGLAAEMLPLAGGSEAVKAVTRGAVGLTLVGLGAHRGVLRAVLGAEVLAGASTSRLEGALVEALSLGLAAALELSAAALSAVLLAALVLSLVRRVVPSMGAAGPGPMWLAGITVLTLSLDRVAHHTAERLAAALSHATNR